MGIHGHPLAPGGAVFPFAPQPRTRYQELLDAGAQTVTIYYVMPSGRVRHHEGVEDPDRPGTYLTPRMVYSGYPLGAYTGQLTPGEAVSDWIAYTAIRLEAARKKVASLERALARYEAAQEALAQGEGLGR